METCKSGSEGGCREPVAYAIRHLCPTLRLIKINNLQNDAVELQLYPNAESGTTGQG